MDLPDLMGLGRALDGPSIALTQFDSITIYVFIVYTQSQDYMQGPVRQNSSRAHGGQVGLRSSVYLNYTYYINILGDAYGC